MTLMTPYIYTSRSGYRPRNITVLIKYHLGGVTINIDNDNNHNDGDKMMDQTLIHL